MPLLGGWYSSAPSGSDSYNNKHKNFFLEIDHGKSHTIYKCKGKWPLKGVNGHAL